MIHSMITRVRYAETDQMGVVHHGNYALYFEMARIEWLRQIGVSYKEMEESGVILPVVNMTTNYHHPLEYDDQITITTRLVKLPTASMVFHFEIFNENKKLCSSAEVTLVFLDHQSRKPMRCPVELFELIKIVAA